MFMSLLCLWISSLAYWFLLCSFIETHKCDPSLTGVVQEHFEAICLLRMKGMISDVRTSWEQPTWIHDTLWKQMTDYWDTDAAVAKSQTHQQLDGLTVKDLMFTRITLARSLICRSTMRWWFPTACFFLNILYWSFLPFHFRLLNWEDQWALLKFSSELIQNQMEPLVISKLNKLLSLSRRRKKLSWQPLRLIRARPSSIHHYQ